MLFRKKLHFETFQSKHCKQCAVDETQIDTKAKVVYYKCSKFLQGRKENLSISWNHCLNTQFEASIFQEETTVIAKNSADYRYWYRQWAEVWATKQK